MIKIVLDTNIFISGTFWSGDSAKILRLIESREVILVTSSEIIEEYNRILFSDEMKEKVDFHSEKTQAVQKITQLALFVQPTVKLNVVKDDPDDNKFIEAAVAGNVQFIVSKDKHLLNIKKYNEIPIVLPEDFLKEARLLQFTENVKQKKSTRKDLEC